MSEVQLNKTCLVLCENCGIPVEAHWRKGVFGIGKGWVLPKNECPECRRPLKPRKIPTVKCPYCGRLVEKSEDGTCLSCHKMIFRSHETVQVTCPECGITNVVLKKHEGSVNCCVCGSRLPENLISQYQNLEYTEPQSISLPTAQEMTIKRNAEGRVVNYIWKHPEHTFAYKSRVIVSEGTYCLLFQNGACGYPLGPGSYLLEDCSLEESEKFDEAMKSTGIVFRTDLFCVAKQLGSVHVGASSRSSAFRVPGSEKEYSVSGNADLSLEVIDARAFAEFVGFREVGKEDLLYLPVSTTDSRPAGSLIATLRDVFSSCLYDAVVQLTRTMSADPAKIHLYQQELTEAVRDRMNDRLNRLGLRVESLSGAEYQVHETETSSTSTKNREVLLRTAKTPFDWKASPFDVYIAGNHDLKTELKLSGRTLLKVDEDIFLRTSAVEKLLSSGTSVREEDVSFLIQDLFQKTLDAYLPSVVQRMIQEGLPEDIRDFNQVLPEVTARLTSAVEPTLRLHGLEIYTCTVSPASLTLSQELTDFYALEKKQKQIQQFVETTFDWSVPRFQAHVKDRPEYSFDVSYSGTCRFRLLSRERFFALSEAEQFVQKTPAVTKLDVQNYYRDLVSSQFGQHLQTATQQFIDTFDPDVRYLSNLTGRMMNYIDQQLEPLINAWALRIESMTLLPHVSIVPGSVLDLNLNFLKGKASREIDLLEHKDIKKNEVETHQVDADAEVAMGQTDLEKEKKLVEQEKERIGTLSSLKDAQTDEEIRRKGREERIRVYEYELEQASQNRKTEAVKHELSAENEIKVLRDRMTADQKTRDFDALFEEFRRRKTLDEAAINKQLDEDDLRQSGKIRHEIAWIEGQQKKENLTEAHRQQLELRQQEHERTIAGIQHATGLDKAEFDRTLNGILHEIDSANLDWRRKLDEYSRLLRQMNFSDTLDEKRQTANEAREESVADAQAQLEIAGTKVEATARIHEEQVAHDRAVGKLTQELNEAQAELAERMARWAEDRRERQDASAYNRQERKDILTFEHQLQDRREMAAQQLDMLKLQYDHETAKWEYEKAKDEQSAELEKLRLQLDYFKAEAEKRYGAEEVRIKAEQAAREAEAKYRAEHEEKDREAELKRLEDQQKRSDSLMDKAVDLYKTMTEIEKALQLKQMDVRMHESDNQVTMHGQDTAASTAIASQNNLGKQLSDKLDDLKSAITDKNGEKVTHSFDLLLDSIRDLRRTIVTNEDGKKGSSHNDSEELIHGLKKLTKSIDDLQKKIQDEMEKLVKEVKTPHCPVCGTAMSGKFCSNCGYPGSKRSNSGNVFAPAPQLCPICGRVMENGRCPVCK